ncbi:MAG: hypothetical protein AAGF26_01650, partial [Cyanobacteria bacterium P01_G01_bin.49]
MNNIQLKIKLVSVNTDLVGENSKIVVSGTAKYQFGGNNKTNTRQLAYRAFGRSALALQEAKQNSVHIISGSLNVYPPNDQNPNHTLLLTINQSFPVSVAQPTAKTVAQTNSVEKEA